MENLQLIIDSMFISQPKIADLLTSIHDVSGKPNHSKVNNCTIPPLEFKFLIYFKDNIRGSASRRGFS